MIKYLFLIPILYSLYHSIKIWYMINKYALLVAISIFFGSLLIYAMK